MVQCRGIESLQFQGLNARFRTCFSLLRLAFFHYEEIEVNIKCFYFRDQFTVLGLCSGAIISVEKLGSEDFPSRAMFRASPRVYRIPTFLPAQNVY